MNEKEEDEEEEEEGELFVHWRGAVRCDSEKNS